MSKKNSAASLVYFLLLFALSFSAAVADVAAGRGTQAQEQQQQQRQRRVVPTASPTQRPRPVPSPSTTAPARAVVGGVTGAQAPPTPAATPVRASITTAPKTLEDLRAQIQEVVRQPQFAASQLAVKVASLDTGQTLYEENAGKWLQPASNMKIYTVAAALDRLSPDYRFTTSVYAPAPPDAAGTVRGDLIIYGRGDPSFSSRFNDGDYFRAIDELAARVVAAGVRRVEGDLIGDESYFTGTPYAPGWEWDDLQWYYGAEVSALSINDNALDLFVKPGVRAGDAGTVTTGPATPLITIMNRTTTSPRGSRRELIVYRPLGENVIEVSGSLPQDDPGFNASVAIARPAMLFVSMLRSSLQRQGVVITGNTRTVDARIRARQPLQFSMLVELTSRQSPPLSVIAAQTLKPSQNLYTELTLRALGKVTGTDPKLTSDEAGIAAVRAFLQGAGIDPNKIVMLDGSGLSQRDRVTAEATLQLLIYMNRHRYANAFREALPIAGIDGTLRNRMKGTPAAGNARAKTGTLSSATSLSGYVTSAAGERLVFSLIVNNPPGDTDARTSFTEAITVLLASFAGRT